MEYGRGASDKWVYQPGDAVMEKLLDRFFVGEPFQLKRHSPNLQVHTMRKWIEWAYRNGDPTVSQVAEAASFPPPYLQYQTSIHSTKDFPATISRDEIPDKPTPGSLEVIPDD